MDAIVVRRGKPQTVAGDNGAEPASKEIFKWWERTETDWCCIALGKPTQSALVEFFNGRACGTNA